MTSRNTQIEAVSNGSAISTDVQSERKRGFARLRDEECYHLMGLVLSALRETEHLIREVHDKASDRYGDYSGDKGAPCLDAAEVTSTLGDAYQCACTAVTYIDKAAMRWLDDEPESPF